jgi:probable phosphoglycerate mutase
MLFPVPPRAYLLIRHGETEWSATGRHTGRTDLPLTDDGRTEARSLSTLLLQLLRLDEPAAVFSSPRQRARDTATLSLGSFETPVVVTDLLAEYDYGDYEGLTNTEIQALQPRWELFDDGCPGGESVAEIGARADRFIELAESATPRGGTTLVFTHGHLSRVLAARLLGLPPKAGKLLLNDTASVGEIHDRRGTMVLHRWNLRPPGATMRPD